MGFNSDWFASEDYDLRDACEPESDEKWRDAYDEWLVEHECDSCGRVRDAVDHGRKWDECDECLSETRLSTLSERVTRALRASAREIISHMGVCTAFKDAATCSEVAKAFNGMVV